MNDDFEYVFPAIRGIQAGREYYVSQCPLRLIPRIFQFDDPDLPATVRAQRALNRNRLPEMARYLVDNRESYVFSALTASIDSDVTFTPVQDAGEASRIGTLRIPMTAKFIINDGQHRRAAIEQALDEEPSLGDETIAVVFFLDRGLERCQQMFADLNRHAIRPSASIGILFDHRDPTAAISRSVVGSLPMFADLVETERSTLSRKSRKLFTLSALHSANRALLTGVEVLDLTEDHEKWAATVADFWAGMSLAFPEWELVHQRELSASEVRKDFIHTFSVFLHALGNVGAELLADGKPDWSKAAKKLKDLDYTRANADLWEGRLMSGGRVSKGGNNVILTTNALKERIGLELTPDQLRVEALMEKGAA